MSQKKEIVDLVRDRWKKGKRPDGSIIGRYKSFIYELEKRQRNPLAGGRVDLFDTGQLSSNLTLNAVIGGAVIFSNDQKASLIAQKYGLDVFGLSNKEMQMVLEEVGVRLIEYMMKEVYGVL